MRGSAFSGEFNQVRPTSRAVSAINSSPLETTLQKYSENQQMTFSTKKILLGRQLAIVGLVATSNVTLAQEAAGTLEEVIVTASKRETALQDTPIAITVLTGDTLEEFNIQNSHDMLSSVIGLEGTITAGNLALAIRGVNSENTDVTSDPTVAFHMDGVFRGRQSGGLAAFHDIERVETLKGPQGTLYGRNATAGTINVITRKPVFATEGSIEVLGGNYDRLGFRGVFNAPVVDDMFAVRIAAAKENRDGYLKNGPLISKPYGDAEDRALRVHALITPNDRLSVLLTADYQDRGGAGDATNRLAGVNAHLINDLPNPHTVIQNTQGFRDDRFMTWKGEVNYDLSFADLTYIGAHYQSDVNFHLDSDRSTASLSTLNIRNGSEQVSHELRLVSRDSGPLQWLAGLYFLDEDATRFTTSTNPGIGLIASTTSIPDYNVKSKAIFTQGTYSFSENFRVTAGIRYSEDEKSQNGTTYYRSHAVAGESLIIGEDSDGSWDSTSWTLGVDGNPVDNTMVYAKVGTGFKAGAFNVANPSFNIAASSFRPEEIIAYQVGHKSTFLNDQLQINSELFLYDYTDLQVTQRAEENTITTNAASADIKGFETELVAIPTDALRITLAVGYLDAKYGQFLLIHPFTGVDTQLDGSDMVKSPKWTANASLSYTFDLAGGWQIIPRIRAGYRDEMKLLPHDELGSLMPARTVLDASVDIDSADERWRVRLFANNITDELVWTGAGTSGQARILTGSPPVMYGASLQYSFGE